jgi:hypothetical protein
MPSALCAVGDAPDGIVHDTEARRTKAIRKKFISGMANFLDSAQGIRSTLSPRL